MSTPAEEAPSLVDLLDARAKASPDHTLLVDEEGRRMTCAELRHGSIHVAERLAVAGIGPNSLVSWVLPTAIDTLVVTAALSRLGAMQNPIIPVYREREIGHILDETSVDLMIVTPQWRGVDYRALCSNLAAARGGRPLVFTLEQVVHEAIPLPAVGPGADHEDLAPAQWMFYTSGTAGLPKGVRHTDGTLAAAAAGMVDHLAITEDDRSGIAFPIAHIGGPINLMAGLLSGATLILIEHFDPEPTASVLAREGVTMAGSGTAFHLAYLDVQAGRPDAPIFPVLRCCPGGGAPKPAGLHERVKRELGGCGIVSSWGLTEAPVLTMGRPTDPDAKLSESEGRPLPGVDLRVVAAGGRPCRAGEPGELRVRAPQVMLGYVDRSLDGDAFDEEGFMRTGDLGVVDAEDFVRITGRLKDVVIRNGENIATAEVEELVRGHPAIADAAVIGLLDERTGERVCAVVELVPGTTAPTLSALGEFLKGKGLRPIAWPEQLEVVVALPRTVTGKIDKGELAGRFG
ncbi:MAG TPA: AMP-binding protein [Acidimicrobiales bacterium]|jgi:acyl-CoA synthetase (AMP-forming)/AMP-acid ligase II|nr:AMP-binding protein [Acidimicrobiales bacterium]